MIKNIRIRINVDQRGAITCGSLVDGRPRGLDHFDLSPFPELQAVYGKRPTSLVIYLPMDDLLSCFDCEYSAWGRSPSGAVKKRICDGEECLHRLRESVGSETYSAGEISACSCAKLSEEHSDRCRYSAHLKVYLAHPETRELISPVCYILRTHSSNSGAAVYSELQKVQGLTSMIYSEPRLTGIPFLISVAMVSRRDDASRKFPIWRIQALAFEPPVGAVAPAISMSTVAGLPAPTGHPGSEGYDAAGDGELPAASTDPVVGSEPSVKEPDVKPGPLTHSGPRAVIAEIDRLGLDVFGELWPARRSAGALKVSGNAVAEIERLSSVQLQSLKELLERSPKRG